MNDWTTQSKIVERDHMTAIRQHARRQGQTVVWTNGCFDLLHVGHIRSLQAAKSLGDLLVVGLNSDSSVQKLKGMNRPIIPHAERAEILAALACVDYVIVFNELTPIEILSAIQPDICCKGAEYRPPGGRPIPELNVIHSFGGRIEFSPLVEGVSTTNVVDRIREKTVRPINKRPTHC